MPRCARAPSHAFSSSTSPYAATRGSAFEHPGAVEQAGVAGVAGPGVDFHALIIAAEEYGSTRKSAPRTRQRQPRRAPARRAAWPAPRPVFRRRLLDWYRRNGRDLPWRQTRDPYRILVSEVMLQQTQVDRVLPKYHEWLDEVSDAARRLPAAPEDEVSATWRPLGYNIRPRRLHAIARESVERYGGELPDDEATLRSFKGIGAYTAGAVLSFAFGQRAAILDTNVARVLFRVFVGQRRSEVARDAAALWGFRARCCRCATCSISIRR